MAPYNTRTTLVGALVVAATVSFAGYAQAANTRGCGVPHDPGYHGAQDGRNKIQSGGYTRRYGVYVPKEYNENKTHKLIIDFHGRNGSPEDQYENSQYYRYPDGESYLVAYPLGLKGRNDETSWQGASYAVPGVDDLSFTTELVAHLRQNYCINSNHIYASGKSNGGGFVDTLACSPNGNEFAAFAMASPALYTDNACNQCMGGHPPQPRMILQAHGFDDCTIKYSGGRRTGGTTPNITQWAWWWAQRNGCTAQATPQEFDGYQYTSYSCDSVNKVVQYYGVYGLGHCWPQADGPKNTDYEKHWKTCQIFKLDFTAKVLEFFAARSLNASDTQEEVLKVQSLIGEL